MNEEDAKEETAPAPPLPAPGSPHVLPYATQRTQILQYSSPADPIDEWVNIFRAQDYLEANLLAGKLQEKGLRARVDMENASALGHRGLTGQVGTDVQVLVADATKAREVIDELEKVRLARLAPGRVPCPQCGHTPVLRQIRPIRVAAVAAFLLFILTAAVSAVGGLPKDLADVLPLVILGSSIILFIVPAIPRWLCPACGHRWAQAEPEDVEEDEDDDDDEEDNEVEDCNDDVADRDWVSRGGR